MEYPIVPQSFLTSALILVVLLNDEAEFDAQFDYLWSLFDHTEAFQEQAAWCWLHKYRAQLR